MKTMKKIFSVILVIAILLSLAIIGTVNSYAYDAPPNSYRLPEYTPSSGIETQTLMFAMPGSWANGVWMKYGCSAGLYWWGHYDNPDDYPDAHWHGWPGWKMKQNEIIKNLYTTPVPKGTSSMIFNNFIDSGMDTSYPEYDAAMQTKDLTQQEYFGQGDCDYIPLEFWNYIYDNYYDAFLDDPNYQIAELGDYAKNFFYSEDDDSIYYYADNMVFVVDTVNTDRTQISPVSGKPGLDGAFYFYYGNGEFGIWPTKEMCIEKEGLKVDEDGNVLIDQETVQEDTDFVIRNHTNAYDRKTKIDFVVFGNITGKYWGTNWTLDENGTLTISVDGDMEDYEYNNSKWYYQRLDIKNVIIEDGVTSIGDYTFSGCTELKSVTIPDSVKSIGEGAFYGCTGLTSVEIPNSVTSIGESAFYGCTSLTNLTFSDSVTSINEYAFCGCTSLARVEVPDNVTNIGYQAFYNCSKDLFIVCNPGSAAEYYAIIWGIKTNNQKFKYRILEDGTVEVTNYLDTFTDIIIPSTYQGKPVTSIKNWLFLNNSDITSVTIPDSVTNIGKGAFYSCVELKTVNMGNNVTEIGLSAFEKCIQLENINLSTNLQTIGDEAFYDCRRLKSLDMPQTLTSIGEEAFTNCRSLTSLEIPAGVNKLGDESSLGSGMFENCRNLEEIKIPESVSYIQSNAFDGCKNLTIVGASGSYAQSYSAENQIQFRAIVDELPVGDANGDNSIDVLDAAAIQKYASGKADLSPGQITAADVNNDGVADILDAAEIQKYAAGKITEFKKKA